MSQTLHNVVSPWSGEGTNQTKQTTDLGDTQGKKKTNKGQIDNYNINMRNHL